MSKLQSGTSFVDGISYNASAFNAAFSSALVLSGIITEQTASGALAGGDSFLIYSVSAAGLRYATLTQILAAIPSNAAAGTPSMRTLSNTGTTACAGNDPRLSNTLSSSVGKLRKIGTGGTGNNDAAATPPDLAFPSVNLGGSATINWDLGDYFYDTLTGGVSFSYTFSNVRDGRCIVLELDLTGYSGTITWPALFGNVPAQTNGGRMIYVFTKTGIHATKPSGFSKAF